MVLALFPPMCGVELLAGFVLAEDLNKPLNLYG